ncbi:MAG: rRNA maturation RNase YbeY [Burkholderiales bacterium]|nr:rRNA maturation RNase YbeY [Burkholderiales bacterium]
MRRRRQARLALSVQYGVRAAGLPARREFARWARAARRRAARLAVRVVGAREGLGLNRRFRGQRHATNVLTFLMRRRPVLEGDIALCAPVIRREARARGKALAAHYAHLVVHGVLHLQGHDHATPREARAMERRESRIVTGLGFPDPWRENSG